MVRTQIQLPDALYAELKRVAEEQEWSLAEAARRGIERLVRCYPPDRVAGEPWRPPGPFDVGDILAPEDRWRELANERDGVVDGD